MKAGRVMHCDISANNVRLWRPASGRVRGMLIDLEKGCFLDEHGQNASEIMTVCRDILDVLAAALTPGSGHAHLHVH